MGVGALQHVSRTPTAAPRPQGIKIFKVVPNRRLICNRSNVRCIVSYRMCEGMGTYEYIRQLLEVLKKKM